MDIGYSFIKKFMWFIGRIKGMSIFVIEQYITRFTSNPDIRLKSTDAPHHHHHSPVHRRVNSFSQPQTSAVKNDQTHPHVTPCKIISRKSLNAF